MAHAIKVGRRSLTGRQFMAATGVADEEPAGGRRDRCSTRSACRSPFVRSSRWTRRPSQDAPVHARDLPGDLRPDSAIFRGVPEAKLRGYTASRFSFNTAGGRCPTCEGAGRIRLEMAFMPDTYLPCDDCRGLRYGPDWPISPGRAATSARCCSSPLRRRPLSSAFTPSSARCVPSWSNAGSLSHPRPEFAHPVRRRGAAAQAGDRTIPGLASYRERSRGLQPHNLYLLEEPTIGLHLSDCEKLIRVLHALVDQGHSVIVIEQQPRSAGRSRLRRRTRAVGGPDGGELLYQGELRGLCRVKGSPTAPYLRQKLGENSARRSGAEIVGLGRRLHHLDQLHDRHGLQQVAEEAASLTLRSSISGFI